MFYAIIVITNTKKYKRSAYDCGNLDNKSCVLEFIKYNVGSAISSNAMSKRPCLCIFKNLFILLQ